jgi:PAS domain S-box-containing protein
VKIPTKFLYINVMIIAVAIIFSTLFSLMQMRSEAARQAYAMQQSNIKAFWRLLMEKGRDFRIADGKLLAGNYVINRNYELPDTVKEIFGGAATIFMSDERVSTNVLMDDGKRAVGTRLTGPAYDTIFRHGKPFRGETLILGVPYFSAYDPIRNVKGEVIGALFVGVKKSDFFSAYDRLKVKEIVMSACLIVIFTLLTALMLRERKRAEMKLQEYNAGLEEQVAARTIELKTANERLVSEVSGRGKAEEALRLDRDNLTSIFEAMKDAIYIVDSRHNIQYGNRALEKDFGPYEGRRCYEYFNETAEVCPSCRIQDVLTGKTVHCERFFPKSGKTYDVIETPLKKSGDSAKLAIFRDVSERKQALEAVLESESRLKALTDCAQDAILMMDPNGDVSYWNPAAERIFGYTAAEAIGRNLHELIVPGRYLEAHRAAFPGFRRSGSGAVLGKTLELHALRKDGMEISVSLSLSAVLLRQAWHAIGVLRDITDKKRAEEELLRAKDAAEEASRLKSEFLANMSHEIRTPMNGVIGMAELLMDTELSREQGECVQAVKSSAEALMTIINDILDFSKIEARKLEIESVNFNLRDSLGDILHTLTHRAADKGLELACDIHPDVPDAVVGDPGRLRQIIVNLVGNAIKFTDEGEVVVSVAVSEQGEDETSLRFTVTDTGIGIAPENRKRIFESFTQADASTTRRYGGTGLGLTISARLVELMGGRIRVESEVGRGSVFHFTVRLGLRKGSPVSQIPEKLANLQGLPVLVVDDNATNRRILEEMLGSWRMRPATAEGGLTALEMLAEAREKGEPFRLLILDVNMPLMDGFEVAERIRVQPGYGESPIMVLTSSGMRGDATRCRELGISAYLTKPVKQSSLLDAIMTVLGTTEPEGATPPLVTQHTLRETLCPLRILLAEDNAVNRRIAVGMLEKRGHTVVVSANGKEALAALEAEGERPFDLIIMDVQMPEMDGIEATALIREKEKGNGRRIPIIALTAHAMKGDRDICINAGMDGYVSKPLRANELLAAMEQVVGLHPETTESAADRDIDKGKVFDREQTLAGVDGDMELLREVAGLFLVEYPKTMAEIRDAIDKGDPHGLNRAAHALKGSVGNFGARNAFDLALGLEMMGKNEDLSHGREAFALLAEEMERLKQAFTDLMGGDKS